MKKFDGENRVKHQTLQLCTQSLEGELQKEIQIVADQNLEGENLDWERKILTVIIAARRVTLKEIVEHQRKILAPRNLSM